MQRSRVTISALPPDVLLEIFKSYVNQIYDEDAWYALVHVCQVWRDVVFSSPRQLHLELRCTNTRPVKKMLDVWPALPVVIDAFICDPRQSDMTNIVAALKRHDLVCRINIWGVPNWLLKSAAFRKRFPQLTDLTFRSNKANAPVIPDSFLGGSAPRLRSLQIIGIPFPALGKLLLSSTHLVAFHLLNIPNSGYIPPEQIATGLSALTMLQEFSIGFRSPRSRADRDRRPLPLLKRLVLPSLTEFYFKGDSKYLEDVVGRIDAPALMKITITFFNQLVFETPLLREFLSRTEVFQDPYRADVSVTTLYIKFVLFQLKGTAERLILEVQISSRVAEWQLSSMAQFCNTSLPSLPTLECLGIYWDFAGWPEPTDDVDSAPWLELFNSFVTVKDLVLSESLDPYVASALQALAGSTATEVLPVLRRVFVNDLFSWSTAWEALLQFSTARRLSGHPVALYSADRVRRA